MIGAGPNGLAAAITLAEAGRSVLVIEGAPTIGGGARSAELTLPGFVHDVCSAVHPLAVASPGLRSMQLERHGLRWLHPEVPLAHPLPSAPAAVMLRSLDDTAAGLGADGRAWARLFGPLVRNADHLIPQLLGPVLRLPRHPLVMARFGLSALRSAHGLNRRFSDDQAAALLAGNAAHSFLPLDAPLSGAFGVMLAVTGHHVGWPVAAGGSQAIVDAMARRLTELGGCVETGRRVTSLTELPAAHAVLFDTSPGAVVSIAGDRLSSALRRRLTRFRHGPAAFKVDYALSGPVPWDDERCRRAGTVHVGGTAAEIEAAEHDVSAGRMPDRPFVLVSQPSVVDPSRAPAGHHVLWAYAHVPHGYVGDATEALEAQIDRFAPGWRDLVMARHVITPEGFEAYNPNYVGGDIGGGSHDGLQLLVRPTWRPYRTSDPSLFLCSASTPPGAGVHGMCGVHSARAVLRGPLR